ncbi:hypothetical protein COUCH_15730 [Couchioplanes caeruleus]|uniref:hypothetical protein n=1 Tax=Couchioplanes caeruleus TaxID=56438 RepID=UPI0020BD98F0|nr:hypothetical protein [Couchioplanes caeruleus]UQU67630.1 hypothetical protein COUCH_15730 [Couchioplanes caeruleus]
MGYTGRILVARTGPFPGALFEQERAGGWRWIQLDGDVPGALGELVEATGTPAISAFVLDSDVADVQALTPHGQRWRTYLNPDVANRFGAPPLSMTPDEVLRAAISWAAEAGLTADAVAVREALEAHHVEAEEAFEDLITALGVV